MGVLRPLVEVARPPAGIRFIDCTGAGVLAPGGGLVGAGCADKGVEITIVAIAVAAIKKCFMG
jgi:hypothetical protein